MPTELEIDVARCVIQDRIRAYWEADPADAEKMVDGYREMAKAALEAAERVREQHRVATCTHPNKWGSGTMSSDGSSKLDWHCKDCGKSFHSETPAQPASPLNILTLPRN